MLHVATKCDYNTWDFLFPLSINIWWYNVCATKIWEWKKTGMFCHQCNLWKKHEALTDFTMLKFCLHKFSAPQIQRVSRYVTWHVERVKILGKPQQATCQHAKMSQRWRLGGLAIKGRSFDHRIWVYDWTDFVLWNATFQPSWSIALFTSTSTSQSAITSKGQSQRFIAGVSPHIKHQGNASKCKSIANKPSDICECFHQWFSLIVLILNQKGHEDPLYPH